MGSSSIICATLAPQIVPPSSSAWRIEMSPTSSPFCICTFTIRTGAPICTRKSSTAARVGFSPTPPINNSAPGSTRAAPRKNIAEEISPGTDVCRPVRRGRPIRRTALPLLAMEAPNSASAISVWSRVRTGSTSAVSPAANIPASRMADFTWALGLGSVYSIGFKTAPEISSGANCLSRAAIFAPICSSGTITRRIGRRRSDSSPVSVLSKFWPASTPASILIVVPEFPASSLRRERLSPVSPTPPMRTRSCCRSIATPIRRRHSSVRAQSSALE